MSCCIFFGHRYVSEDIENKIKRVLYYLITDRGIDEFLVGDNGEFDGKVWRILLEMKEEFPHIKCNFVPAYQPVERSKNSHIDFTNAIFPDEGLKSPRKYAIANRNSWMIKNADIVVVYVRRVGNARDLRDQAIKRKKK